MTNDNYVCPEIHDALIEANLKLVKQLEECDNHLRRVLLGAAKVSRPSYHDKQAFDSFQKWRDDCHEAEKWRSLSLDNNEDRRERSDEKLDTFGQVRDLMKRLHDGRVSTSYAANSVWQVLSSNAERSREVE